MTFSTWLRALFGAPPRQPAVARKGPPRLEGLEDRLVLTGYRVTAQLEVLATEAGAPGTQVVFFEPGVAGFQVLRQGLAAGADAVELDGSGDGLAEMAAFLRGRHGLSAVHLVSHGAPGALQLGSAALDEQALADRPAEVAALGQALAPGGDLLLWGCGVAAGPQGQAFLRELASASGPTWRPRRGRWVRRRWAGAGRWRRRWGRCIRGHRSAPMPAPPSPPSSPGRPPLL
jgi:hypothetical protein